MSLLRSNILSFSNINIQYNLCMIVIDRLN
nr:MAG TPA: hypothetical protein [Caudoviricetes sp.]